MSEIFTKKYEHRITDPSNDPTYEKAFRVGQENWKTMQHEFETESEKNDYIRQVKSNPNNVIGLPPFFPAKKIKLYLRGTRKWNCNITGHRWSNTIDKFCLECEVDKKQKGVL